MKKLLAVIGFMLLLIVNVQVVHAGTINEYEAEVIKIAKGQFESGGITYQVDPVYIQQLIDFLMQDDVDITSEQKDKAISMMFSEVEQGIEAGYLIPVVVEESTQESSNLDEPGNLEEETNQTEELNEEDGIKDTEESKETEGKEGNTTVNTPDEFVKHIIDSPATITQIDKDKGKVTVTKGEDKSVITVNTVIKNTGFNLNITVIMASLLVIVMVICIFVTFRLNLYVKKDDKSQYDKS